LRLLGRDFFERRDPARNTIIRNNSGIGIAVQKGGTAEISGGEIVANGGGANTNGSALTINGTTISENLGVGIGVEHGGAAFITGSEISKNGSGASTIGGSLIIMDTIISANKGRGIEARNVSTVQLWNSTVEDNQGDGIWLGDVSLLEISGVSRMSITTRVGPVLFPEPAVAHCKDCQNLTFSENESGDITLHDGARLANGSLTTLEPRHRPPILERQANECR